GNSGDVRDGALDLRKSGGIAAIDHQRNSQLTQPGGQDAQVLDGPLFGAPAGERRSEHEIAFRERALGTAGRQWKNARSAGSAGKVEILVYLVRRGAGDSVRVKQRGGPFAEHRGIEAEETGRAGGRAGHSRLQQSLEIEGQVVVMAAKFAPAFENA